MYFEWKLGRNGCSEIRFRWGYSNIFICLEKCQNVLKRLCKISFAPVIGKRWNRRTIVCSDRRPRESASTRFEPHSVEIIIKFETRDAPVTRDLLCISEILHNYEDPTSDSLYVSPKWKFQRYNVLLHALLKCLCFKHSWNWIITSAVWRKLIATGLKTTRCLRRNGEERSALWRSIRCFDVL